MDRHPDPRIHTREQPIYLQIVATGIQRTELLHWLPIRPPWNCNPEIVTNGALNVVQLLLELIWISRKIVTTGRPNGGLARLKVMTIGRPRVGLAKLKIVTIYAPNVELVLLRVDIILIIRKNVTRVNAKLGLMLLLWMKCVGLCGRRGR